MSGFARLLGLIGSIFQIDVENDGPQLKHPGSGVLEVRNSADSAYSIIRGAEPVGDDDLVTKKYHDDNTPGRPGWLGPW